MEETKMEAAEPKAAVKKKSKVGDIIVTVVLVLAILLAIFAGYSAYATKAGTGVPSVLGIRPFAVQSDSMAPTFNKGDLIIDKAVDAETLEVGDVITFWTVINGQKVLNTHRITQITDYGNYLYFDTKGDNNTIADTDGVHQRDIVGMYLFRIPNVGTVLDFLQTTLGFGLCIVLPVAIFFIYEIIQFFKTLMEYKTEKVKQEMEEKIKAEAERIAAEKEAAKAAEASAKEAEAAAKEPEAEEK